MDSTDKAVIGLFVTFGLLIVFFFGYFFGYKAGHDDVMKAIFKFDAEQEVSVLV